MKKESTGNVSIYMKIWKAKQSIGKIHKSKTAKGEKFSYKYADLNSVLEIIDPILYENGLVCLQPIEDNKVYTFIVDIDSGEHISSFMTLPALNDPQKLGSAISYYRRYTLTSCLSISTTDDDDGNSVAQAVNTKQPTVSDEMLNKYLESVKAGTNKWPVQKFMDTYDLTTAQKDILILHQL
jgi:hypothetical protein